MRKFNLTIPEPCHEDWNKMTKNEKGKFCGSCQKTVIDFTTMNDRQLAEFFKRPPSSVCGHFQQNQLEREILIPRKRLPWIKYFFQFSLPAFLVSMKASAQGNVRVKDTTTCFQIPGSISEKKPIWHFQIKDIEAKKIDSDSLNENMILSGFVVMRKPDKENYLRSIPLIKKWIDTAAFSNFYVYPNLLRTNSSFWIDTKKIEKGNYDLSIISMSGISIQVNPVVIENKNQVLNCILDGTRTGTYFIRLTNKKSGKSYTEKIIVQ